MASLVCSKTGVKRILFYGPNGKRKSIHLGQCSKTEASKVKTRVESLLASILLGNPIKQEDATWLATQGAPIREKLAKAGLCDSRAVVSTVSEFVSQQISKSKLKPGTLTVWRQVQKSLDSAFPDLRLDQVTVGHAKQFLANLKARNLAPDTIAKRISIARQWFEIAVDWQILTRNPFDRIKAPKSSVVSNVEVPREWIDQILRHCDREWRLIVVLSRYGGLRCPSEVLSLRWDQIDWEGSRMSVPEPKVEHHEGRGVRLCPIFPEIMGPLREAYEAAPDGAIYVVDKPAYRAAAKGKDGWRNSNLRTQFLKIVGRAGLAPWKRIFHSMRATRQTELELEYPLHVVCSWLGNSEAVAKKRYLLVRESDFARASGVQRGTNPALQDRNTVQNRLRTEDAPRMHQDTETQGKHEINTCFVSVSNMPLVDDIGLEHFCQVVGNGEKCGERGTNPTPLADFYRDSQQIVGAGINQTKKD